MRDYSTRCFEKQLQLSIQEAADKLLRWVFYKGRRLRGLVLRGKDERVLFLATYG